MASRIRLAPNPAPTAAPDVRRLRRPLDLTQWDLANLAGCSQGSIAKTERGRQCSPELFKRIVDALLAAEAKAKGR